MRARSQKGEGPGRVLREDACPACGLGMVERHGRLRSLVNGEGMIVPSAAHLACPKCGEIVLRFEEARQIHEDASLLYRERHGLLSADELRSLRARFGLTQAELARLLHQRRETLARWESGRNVQPAAMDVLLRLLRDLPGSLEYLREHAA